MKRKTRRVSTQLAVIGTGIAGFAATLFARDRGVEVAQFGHSGAMAYTTGYLDLLGAQGGAAVEDPWSALDELRRQAPDHPLARLTTAEIRAAFTRFAAALGEMGLAYTPPGDRNLPALLPFGVVKPTLSVPATMLPGIEAQRTGAPTLIIEFEGLQGFSAAQFQVNMGARWPGLRIARLSFPGMENRQLFPEVMARALETREAREQLAALIRPRLDGATHVGLPAILGVHAPDATRAEIERLTGATLFEIPTIPPGVAGIRLRELFEREFPARGVQLEPNLKVSRLAFGAEAATLYLRGPMEDLEVEAQAVILATGRFLSGGLRSDRNRLSETLLGLPVRQPEGRDSWFRQDYLDPRGHAINRLGVETDADFRPVGADGRPIDSRLFAAGALLAGQDWVRERSGAGVAIASAFGAVRAAVGPAR